MINYISCINKTIKIHAMSVQCTSTYINKVILPYIANKRQHLKLPVNQPDIATYF